MPSTAQMLAKVEGCQGTGDLSDWEEQFVADMARLRDAGQLTKLTGKQVEVLERLHDKHFG